MKKCIYCSFCSTCFSLTSTDSIGANEARAVLFSFVDQKLPTIQYSFLLRKGFDFIQVVCCMVSSFSFQLVVCSLQLQAERCPMILSRNCF